MKRFRLEHQFLPLISHFESGFHFRSEIHFPRNAEFHFPRYPRYTVSSLQFHRQIRLLQTASLHAAISSCTSPAAVSSSPPPESIQVVIEIPYGAMQALLYVVIIYAMIGFEWSVGKFFWYLFFTFFSFLYFTFFGMMMIAMSPDQSVALIMSSFFFTLWNLFSGFVIPKPMIPIWWRWYCWACPVAWSMKGLFSSQYGDIKVVLDDGSTVQQFLNEHYGFRHDFLGVVSGSVIGFALLFATLFAFFVKTFNFQKR